jgi:hypothetical protein
LWGSKREKILLKGFHVDRGRVGRVTGLWVQFLQDRLVHTVYASSVAAWLVAIGPLSRENDEKYAILGVCCFEPPLEPLTPSQTYVNERSGMVDRKRQSDRRTWRRKKNAPCFSIEGGVC